MGNRTFAFKGLFAVYSCTLLVFRIVQELIVQGKCDISPKDDDGMTPLHIACQIGHKSLAKFLLANKADVDHEDRKGHTPLNYAVGNGHKELFRQLILK